MWFNLKCIWPVLCPPTNLYLTHHYLLPSETFMAKIEKFRNDWGWESPGISRYDNIEIICNKASITVLYCDSHFSQLTAVKSLKRIPMELLENADVVASSCTCVRNCSVLLIADVWIHSRGFIKCYVCLSGDLDVLRMLNDSSYNYIIITLFSLRL